jgi:hypothetical protein
MVGRRRMNRARVTSLVAGLCAIPMLVAVASEPGKTSKGWPRPVAVSFATLSGRVTNSKGEPLAEVRVMVANPAIDMRFVDPTTKHTLLVTKTDAKGNYRLEIPGITHATKISLDAMKPGYGRWVGTMMAGGMTRDIDVGPGAEAYADMTLLPALYFAGTVVDEQGKPLSGVKIASDLLTQNVRAAVDRTASNTDGSFELFDFPLDKRKIGNEIPPGIVSFSHRGYETFQTHDVYALEAGQRPNLRIVLKGGHTVSGTIVSADGKPVARLTVKFASDDQISQRATVTDAQGKFVFEGLAGGPMTLRARDAALKQKITLPLLLDTERRDLKVRLQSIVVPRDVQKYVVLGMQFANLTPELRSAYAIDARPGVLVLDPGRRTDVGGPFPEGSVFRTVAVTPVKSVRELVDVLNAVAPDAQLRNRIEVESDGVLLEPAHKLELLQIRQEDLADLAALRDQCRADEQRAILALGKLGAHFRLKPAGDDDRPGREVSLISLGNDWKGSDADLRSLFTVPFEMFVVHGPGKVSDTVLEQLRVARPNVFVGRSPEVYLGADFHVTNKTPRPQVESIAPHSPAALAGLQVGDVMLEFAGKPVPDGGALSTAMSPLKPGQKVTAKVLRGAKTLSLTIDLGPWD